MQPDSHPISCDLRWHHLQAATRVKMAAGQDVPEHGRSEQLPSEAAGGALTVSWVVNVPSGAQ